MCENCVPKHWMYEQHMLLSRKRVGRNEDVLYRFTMGSSRICVVEDYGKTGKVHDKTNFAQWKSDDKHLTVRLWMWKVMFRRLILEPEESHVEIVTRVRSI